MTSAKLGNKKADSASASDSATKTAPKKSAASPRRQPVAKSQSARPRTVKPRPVRPATVKPVAGTAVKSEKKRDKPEKVKVLRDSFTIPKTEYTQIVAMKKRAIDLGLEVKKSELIRAGLLLLAGTSPTSFRKALAQVPTLKTGRPGKE